MGKAIFISLEGGEGVGKSTQIEFMKQWLEKHNLPYVTTFEPGGTELGVEVRKILKHSTSQISPKTEVLLFNACRAELMEEIVNPSLDNGISVISDRFCDSTFVYQAFGRGLNLDEVYDITRYAINNRFPDITFWFDLPPKEAFERKMGADNDRFEQSGAEFHNNVYNGYKKLLEKYPDRIKRIDASKTKEEVSAQIEEYLQNYFFG